jgi:hypothetical protein
MMLVVDDGDLARVLKNLDREIPMHVRYRFGMTVVGGTRKRGSLLRGFAIAGTGAGTCLPVPVPNKTERMFQQRQTGSAGCRFPLSANVAIGSFLMLSGIAGPKQARRYGNQ